MIRMPYAAWAVTVGEADKWVRASSYVEYVEIANRVPVASPNILHISHPGM
ncbi:MAG TPA: hypothetical protein VMM76_02110 [Pirellulaceae bacterium]|nr:hypothetical protein [Pirellulaceae bacterium]